MQSYIMIRIAQGFLAFLGVSLLVFVLVRASGDPQALYAGEDEGDQESIEHTRRLWGLDRPISTQYFIYMRNIVTGNFGDSFSRSGSVSNLIWSRLPATLLLGGVATAISLPISLLLGVVTAVKRDTFFDYFGKLVAFVGLAMPNFWLAIMLIWLFAITLDWLPSSGKGTWLHLVLPIAVLATPGATILRLMRSTMLDQLDSEYVKLARIKGLPEWKIIWKHVFRNAAIVPLTFLGVIFANIVTGSVVVESIFAWPGIGLLAIQSINARDYAVVQAITLMGTSVIIVLHIVVDILYAYVDPRIRFGKMNL